MAASVLPTSAENKNAVLNAGQNANEYVSVPANGEYEFLVVFKTLNDSTQKIEYGIRVDGEYPFEEAKEL